jgi:translation initiation factor 2D
LARFPIGSEYSSKSTLSLAKITTSNGHSVNLYSCDKDPILFEIQDDKNLFPTVYFVWISPSTVPVLLIPPNVMEFIEKGADLMLPGKLYLEI